MGDEWMDGWTLTHELLVCAMTALQKAKFVNENDGSRHFGHGTAAGRFNVNRLRRKAFKDFSVDAAVSHDVSCSAKCCLPLVDTLRMCADSLRWTLSRWLTDCALYDVQLGFASAYAQLPDEYCTGEPKFTIFHSGTKGTVDYMWFTHASLHCHGVLEMTPAGVLFAQKALPTQHDASDHLSLVADFSLTAMHEECYQPKSST